MKKKKAREKTILTNYLTAFVNDRIKEKSIGRYFLSRQSDHHLLHLFSVSYLQY